MSDDTAHSILTEAANIVAGARNTTHGDKERSFDAIARMWNAYLSSRKDSGAPLSPVDVAHLMVLLKMCRYAHGKPEIDHHLDMAGYAAIAGELSQCTMRNGAQSPVSKDTKQAR